MTVRTVLLTGFEPFDGDSINSSWEVARALNLEVFNVSMTGVNRSKVAIEAKVIARQLPCEFERSIQVLANFMKRLKPDLVICLGQANSRNDVSVERVAININDARIRDNASAQPIDTSVIKDGPVAYFSSLPIKAIVHAIRKESLPASISNTAGTFVCNHVFYGLMRLLATNYPLVRGGFIHLPLLPAQAAKLLGSSSLSKDSMVAAVRVAIATALKTKRDHRLSEGALD
jgi:pyroglutamyl-peptidase